ncbi:MAG: DNA-binding protein [Pseudomonadota bacterium]
MPRTGVSYEEVSSAIVALEKAGLTPSIRLIREKVGSGSLSTIAEHKRTYDAEKTSGPGPDLPDAVATGLINGAQAFWQELVDAAEAQIEAIRTQADANLNEVTRELNASRDALTEAREEVGARQATIHELETRIDSYKSELKTERERSQANEVSEARLVAERDAAAKHAERLQTEVEVLRAELTTQKANNAALSERIEQQALEHVKDKSSLQTSFNDYKNRLVTMADELRDTNRGYREAEKRAVGLEKALEAAERSNEQVQRDLTDTKDEARFLTEQLGELRAELNAKAERVETQKARVATLEQELHDTKALLERYSDDDRNLIQAMLKERSG